MRMVEAAAWMGYIPAVPTWILGSDSDEHVTKFVSTTMSRADRASLYSHVYQPGSSPWPVFMGNMTALHSLNSMLARDYDAQCPNFAGHKCESPEMIMLPDVCVSLQITDPNGNNTYIPGFHIEVGGKKDSWGKDAKEANGVIEACTALCFLNRAYLLVVHEMTADFYQLSRVANRGRVSIKKQTFTLTQVTSFRALIEEMAKAFIDVFINQRELMLGCEDFFRTTLGFYQSGRLAQPRDIHFFDSVNFPGDPRRFSCAHITSTGDLIQRWILDLPVRVPRHAIHGAAPWQNGAWREFGHEQVADPYPR